MTAQTPRVRLRDERVALRAAAIAMLTDPRVQDTAARVRDIMVDMHELYEWGADLQGGCWSGSRALALLLRRQGIVIPYVTGRVQLGQVADAWHACLGFLVDVDALYVLDVTATQFGILEEVYVGLMYAPITEVCVGVRPVDVVGTVKTLWGDEQAVKHIVRCHAAGGAV